MRQCPQCGGEVSDRALFCRHCSAPQPPPAEGKKPDGPPVVERSPAVEREERAADLIQPTPAADDVFAEPDEPEPAEPEPPDPHAPIPASHPPPRRRHDEDDELSGFVVDQPVETESVEDTTDDLADVEEPEVEQPEVERPAPAAPPARARRAPPRRPAPKDAEDDEDLDDFLMEGPPPSAPRAPSRPTPRDVPPSEEVEIDEPPARPAPRRRPPTPPARPPAAEPDDDPFAAPSASEPPSAPEPATPPEPPARPERPAARERPAPRERPARPPRPTPPEPSEPEEAPAAKAAPRSRSRSRPRPTPTTAAADVPPADIPGLGAPPPASVPEFRGVVEEREPPQNVLGKLIAIYAIVAIGLGLAGIMILWVSGFFSIDDSLNELQPGSGGFESIFAQIGAVIVGVVGAGSVLLFAIAAGLFLAVIVGMRAARDVGTRRDAEAVAGIAAGVGHVIMIFVVGVMMWASFNIFIGDFDVPQPTPFPITGGATGDVEQCRQVFGADSPLCQQIAASPQAQQPRTESTNVGFPLMELLKTCVAAVPSALVGAAVAALMYPRRRERVL